jgi:hypothetical protein
MSAPPSVFIGKDGRGLAGIAMIATGFDTCCAWCTDRASSSSLFELAAATGTAGHHDQVSGRTRVVYIRRQECPSLATDCALADWVLVIPKPTSHGPLATGLFHGRSVGSSEDAQTLGTPVSAHAHPSPVFEFELPWLPSWAREGHAARPWSPRTCARSAAATGQAREMMSGRGSVICALAVLCCGLRAGVGALPPPASPLLAGLRLPPLVHSSASHPNVTAMQGAGPQVPPRPVPRAPHQAALLNPPAQCTAFQAPEGMQQLCEQWKQRPDRCGAHHCPIAAGGPAQPPGSCVTVGPCWMHEPGQHGSGSK